MNADLRFLQVSALLLTVLLLAIAAYTWHRATRIPHFAQLDVERINFVEPDGMPRLILYNSSHTPGIILRGKNHPHPNRRPQAGILYFNDEGTENGGTLTFDQFDQDQVVSLGGGLAVWDQPYIPIEQVISRMLAATSQPEGPGRKRALAEVNAWALAQKIFTQRLSLGMARDNAAVLELADSERRPRLRAVVDAAGEARIDFIAADGKVTRSITESSAGNLQSGQRCPTIRRCTFGRSDPYARSIRRTSLAKRLLAVPSGLYRHRHLSLGGEAHRWP